MPRYVSKISEELFTLWSSVVDAPVWSVMAKEKFLDQLCEQYGEEKAWSMMNTAEPIENELMFNRAGPNESTASLEEILELYVDDE